VANNPGGSDEDSDDDEYGYWVYKITGRNRSWTVLTTLHKYSISASYTSLIKNFRPIRN
jgi:hypothetical protein